MQSKMCGEKEEEETKMRKLKSKFTSFEFNTHLQSFHWKRSCEVGQINFTKMINVQYRCPVNELTTA